MKTTVVMCVYNGRKYIKEQLDSLRTQTVSIDEVLIIDDCSNDDTVEYIKEYIEKNKLFNWIIKENRINYGWKKNFYEGFKAAKGDLIFPCDQDDIWHPDKIEVMKNIMEEDPEIFVLEGQPHKWFQTKVGTKDILKNKIKSKFILFLDKREEKKEICTNTKNICLVPLDNTFMKTWPGCVLGFRKDFFDLIEDLWIEEIPHDKFVGFFAKAIGHYYSLDYYVIEWRKHVDSATQSVNKTKNRRIKELDDEKKIIKRLFFFAQKNGVKKQCINIIRKALVWNKLRKQLVEERNLKSAIHLIKYRKFYPQFRRYFTDLKYGLQKEQK